MSNAEFVATVIEGKAWKIVKAFDDVAEEQGRQPAYAALILIMTSFIKTSEASAEDILTDFCGRVGAGVYAKPSKPQ